MPSVGIHAEQYKLSPIADENAKWSGHSGRQFGGDLKHFIYIYIYMLYQPTNLLQNIFLIF